MTGGKWLVHATSDEIDTVWECVALTLAHHGFGQAVLKAKVSITGVICTRRARSISFGGSDSGIGKRAKLLNR